jgi:hypothetical protein
MALCPVLGLNELNGGIGENITPVPYESDRLNTAKLLNPIGAQGGRLFIGQVPGMHLSHAILPP